MFCCKMRLSNMPTLSVNPVINLPRMTCATATRVQSSPHELCLLIDSFRLMATCGQYVCIYESDSNYLQTFNVLFECDCSHSIADYHCLQKGCQLGDLWSNVIVSMQLPQALGNHLVTQSQNVKTFNTITRQAAVLFFSPIFTRVTEPLACSGLGGSFVKLSQCGMVFWWRRFNINFNLSIKTRDMSPLVSSIPRVFKII